MPPRNLPTIPASAGAMTRAKTIGLTTGTTSSLGLRALSAKRRRTRVAKARSWAPAGMGRGLVAMRTDVTVADAVISLLLGFQEMDPAVQAARRVPVRSAQPRAR